MPFAPKEVLLDEVSVSGGRVEFTRPGSQPLVFEDVYGAGSAASLSGPYKVSASYIFGGRPQELRFSTSASDAEGMFRLKSALRDPDRNTTYLLEGDVAGFKAKPAFDGAIIMRIASALPPEGQAVEPEGEDATSPAGEQGSGRETHLSAVELKGLLKATPDRAELPNFEIAVHAKGRTQMMKGKLTFEFGEHAKADGELSASWVDVDALLAASAPDAVQAAPSAASTLNAIAERALKEAASVGDGTLTVSFDQASIGGDLVGGIDLVVAAEDGTVSIDRLHADLPGANRIEASGRLAQTEQGPVFEGPITLDGSKLKTLVRWAADARERDDLVALALLDDRHGFAEREAEAGLGADNGRISARREHSPVPAPPPMPAPIAAPLPPPAIAPMAAPTPAPMPIFLASLPFVDLASRRNSEAASRTVRGRKGASRGSAILVLQFGIVVLDELPDLVAEVEQPLPLLQVQRYRHSLQAVDADGALFADLAIERTALGLQLGQELLGLVHGQLPGRQFL